MKVSGSKFLTIAIVSKIFSSYDITIELSDIKFLLLIIISSSVWLLLISLLWTSWNFILQMWQNFLLLYDSISSSLKGCISFSSSLIISSVCFFRSVANYSTQPAPFCFCFYRMNSLKVMNNQTMHVCLLLMWKIVLDIFWDVWIFASTKIETIFSVVVTIMIQCILS